MVLACHNMHYADTLQSLVCHGLHSAIIFASLEMSLRCPWSGIACHREAVGVPWHVREWSCHVMGKPLHVVGMSSRGIGMPSACNIVVTGMLRAFLAWPKH